ncbi:hypothetical protein [Microbacterium sp.]|uniref:hypothetical protein n=1 Tax=Microbacterium sp. TaxID=51671 RepID=UPI003F967C16
MRALPATIEPFQGETVCSVYHRLVERNDLTTGELWTAIRRQNPGLPLRTTPGLVPRIVEDLAGLPRGRLDQDADTHRLFVRCEHTLWQHSSCPACAPLPAPVTMCRRCTGGENVEARARTGGVCARHRRWHYAGHDDDLGDETRYGQAERCLTGPLWQRGIGLDTGELELATELLTLHRQHVGAVEGRGDAAERLRALYPEAVCLTAFLTEPWATRFLAHTHIGQLPVVALIEATVVAVSAHSRSDLNNISETFQATGREASVRITRTVRYGQPVPIGSLGTLVRESTPRLRAVFLRHNDARRPPGTRSSPW